MKKRNYILPHILETEYNLKLCRIFSSPEPKAQVSFCHQNLSGVRPAVCLCVCASFNFFLGDFFSRTTWPISTKWWETCLGNGNLDLFK